MKQNQQEKFRKAILSDPNSRIIHALVDRTLQISFLTGEAATSSQRYGAYDTINDTLLVANGERGYHTHKIKKDTIICIFGGGVLAIPDKNADKDENPFLFISKNSGKSFDQIIYLHTSEASLFLFTTDDSYKAYLCRDKANNPAALEKIFLSKLELIAPPETIDQAKKIFCSEQAENNEEA